MLRLSLPGHCLTLSPLIGASLLYGIYRQYRFEVIVISIDWLALIATGILLSIVFKRADLPA